MLEQTGEFHLLGLYFMITLLLFSLFYLLTFVIITRTVVFISYVFPGKKIL